MSQFRLARLALMLAAVGLNAAPALMQSAAAQQGATVPTAPQPPKGVNGAPAPAAQPADTVRPELYKLLDPAAIKAQIDAKNYTDVQTRLAQADAFPDKTPYEVYVLNRMKLTLATATSNESMQMSALEAVLASGKLPEADKNNFTLALAQMNENAKNYPKAIELYKQVQANGMNTDQVNAALVHAYYLSGDYAQAMKLEEPLLDAQEKAGKTPSQQDLRIFSSAAIKVKDNAAYVRGLEKLAAYYPSDDFWADLISKGIYNRPGYNETYDADVLRLEFAAVKQLSADGYTQLAELALKDGFPTEAKKVVDAGFAAGVLTTAQQKQLRDRATKEAANDAKTIASTEASAGKGKNGAGLVNLGWAYVTMDQFDKGIGFIEQGIAKGGLKAPDEAKLRLGMAYARAGQKDKAIQTFETVKAPGGASDIAHYYVLLLNHPSQGGAATAAAK